MAEEEKKSPLSGILEIYKKSVEEQDEKGYAEIYKQSTEILLNDINSTFRERNSWRYEIEGFKQFTFEDVNYGDGYFIFGMGTNTTIQFHIKEIPGWLFGIWWNEPQEKTSTYHDTDGKEITERWLEVSCYFFTQYEETLDKFKPSRSVLCVRPVVSYDTKSTSTVEEACDMLVFMYKEPELAFCRDYIGWDYNVEYHSRAEAKKEFNGYVKWSTNKAMVEKELDGRMVTVTKKLFEQELNEGYAFLQDRGDNWSPRYEIIINKDAYDDLKDLKAGCYGFSDFFTKAELKELRQEEKACEKLSIKAKFYWCNPVSECFCLLETERYDEIKRAEEELHECEW